MAILGADLSGPLLQSGGRPENQSFSRRSMTAWASSKMISPSTASDDTGNLDSKSMIRNNISSFYWLPFFAETPDELKKRAVAR
jgi:hypothetical protein